LSIYPILILNKKAPDTLGTGFASRGSTLFPTKGSLLGHSFGKAFRRAFPAGLPPAPALYNGSLPGYFFPATHNKSSAIKNLAKNLKGVKKKEKMVL
jgi:hypothetical protein